MDPKLLFPIKAWLRGFLPGHKFHWDEENDLAVQDEMDMEVSTQLSERSNHYNHYTTTLAELVEPFVAFSAVSVLGEGSPFSFRPGCQFTSNHHS